MGAEQDEGPVEEEDKTNGDKTPSSDPLAGDEAGKNESLTTTNSCPSKRDEKEEEEEEDEMTDALVYNRASAMHSSLYTLACRLHEVSVFCGHWQQT